MPEITLVISLGHTSAAGQGLLQEVFLIFREQISEILFPLRKYLFY